MRLVTLLVAAFALPFAACDLITGSDEPEPGPPAYITVVSGNGQTGCVSDTLPEPVVVHVIDRTGLGVPDVELRWLVGYTESNPDVYGTTVPNPSRTDEHGLSSVRVVLREVEEVYWINVSARPHPDSGAINTRLTARASTSPYWCDRD